MQDDVSANLSMPLLMPAQAQKHVTHNEALLVLDALVQLTVLDRGLPFPPSDPVAGQRHIVPAGAGATWGGPDHAVAVFDGVAWQFHLPRPGWRAFVLDEDGEVIWQEGGWQSAGERDLVVGGLGVNATPDATNRLAVASDAVLLTHAGAGHQLKINKAAAGDTASLLYQTNWTGHAELGLAGTNDFSLKVSADGTVWTEALRTEAATGRLIADQGLTLNGTLTGMAVTQTAADATPGRLTKTGDFGLGSAGQPFSIPDLDALTTPVGFYTVLSITPNVASRPAGASNFAAVEVRRYDANRLWQIYYDRADGTGAGVRLWLRGSSGGGGWSDWRQIYTSGSVLGTVSQSGGVPTGAILERSSNANGQYMRFADGTQICIHTLTVTEVIGTAFLGGFRNAGQTWTFPAAFAAGPSVTGTPGSLNSMGILTNGANSTAVSVLHTAFASQASAPLTARMIAIGRWF